MKQKNVRLREGFAGQKLIVLPKKIITGFLSKDPVTRQTYITDIGYYPKAKHHFVERPAGISQHIIIYCTEGTGWLEINKKRVELMPSQFITIPANTPHRYGANTDKPWTIYWMHFKGDIAAFIVGLILKNSENYKPYLSFNEDRIKLFEDICFNLEKGYSEDTLRYVNMIFSHFLSSLIYENQFNHIDKTNNDDFVSKTITHMQERLDVTLKLEDLAAFVNLSASHFSALFKSKTGHSPIEYFNQLKVQKACQYLSFTNMAVKEIALTLGIEDQYYFSRMFTKLMETSPTDYRKKNQTTE
ncbi:AraC family transcriptional regulator [Mucilaginibacter sp. BJC16-A38]|uniref:AraC family transcriptional regulator n=1 Tax=Mucilaginibacter phenanthrenivorans TaxID=1234842 RepID=UPI0021579409|nr:AraC family transcriptional regulator [Mucilaginibacter phenanthrenivorans]MCR8560004.1 AraC family transcriptional regulator [Mucilaginibacter phenanthrenivorans]